MHIWTKLLHHQAGSFTTKMYYFSFTFIWPFSALYFPRDLKNSAQYVLGRQCYWFKIHFSDGMSKEYPDTAPASRALQILCSFCFAYLIQSWAWGAKFRVFTANKFQFRKVKSSKLWNLTKMEGEGVYITWLSLLTYSQRLPSYKTRTAEQAEGLHFPTKRCGLFCL